MNSSVATGLGLQNHGVVRPIFENAMIFLKMRDRWSHQSSWVRTDPELTSIWSAAPVELASDYF